MGIFVLILIPAGFVAGWILTRQELDTTIEVTTPSETTRLPPSFLPAIPETDAPGTDVAGLPRYPSSVRTEYRLEVRGELLVTEAKYLAAAELDPVRGFYREVFRSEGWSVADLDFSTNGRGFFVTRGEREAYVNIGLRDEKLAEIEIKQSQPWPGEDSDPEATDPDTSPSRKPDPAAPGPPDFVPPARGPPGSAPPAGGSPGQGPPDSTPAPSHAPGSAPGSGPPGQRP